MCQTRIKIEEERLDRLPSHFTSRKMDSDFDLYKERECFSCFYDLHLSAVGCECSPDRYSCLKHAKLFCSCEMDKKFVLLRYTVNELNKLVEVLEGESSAVELWKNKSFGMVSADANQVCIDKPDVERDMYRTKDIKEGESLAGCEGAKVKSNLSAPSSPYSHVTSEMMQSECHLVTFSTLCGGSIDSHNGNINDNKMVLDNDEKVDQGGFLDLNLDVSGESENDNKRIKIEEKVHCSEAREGDLSLSLSSSIVKTDFSSCSRDVCRSSTFDGVKYKVDLQMDSDSRKQPNSILKNEVIDITSTSISLARESCLMQMFGASVKLISLGSVVCGKLWCSKHTIYPKGMPQCRIFSQPRFYF